MTNQQSIDKLLSLLLWLDKDSELYQAIVMAISALQAQEWIPAKKLPEKDGSYLVSGRWGSGKEMVGECEYKVHDGYFSTAWNFDVLAWKPLPEPYREGK